MTEIVDKVIVDVFSMGNSSRDTQKEVSSVPSDERHFLFSCK